MPTKKNPPPARPVPDRNLLADAIRRKDWERVRPLLEDLDTPALAGLLRSLDPADSVLLFRLLPTARAGEVFAALDYPDQGRLIEQFKDPQKRRVLRALDPAARAGLLQELPPLIVRKLVYLLPPEERPEAMRLLGYPEESVGSRMEPDYAAVRASWSVAEALEHIRKFGVPSETLDVVYVLDEKRRLLDALPLSEVVLADPGRKIEDLMDRECVSIGVAEDQEKAVRKMRKHGLSALPVADSSGVLVGIVTAGDAFRIAEEETTEDFHKKAAISPLEKGYNESSVWTLYRKRIVWLSLLGLAGFLSAGVIAAFEETIAAMVILASFIPVLIDSGGNTGAQSATLVIRALAVGDLNLKQWLKVIRRELVMGVILGLSLGAVLFLMGVLWRGGPHVGLVVFMAMTCIVLLANLVGGVLPFILIRLKFDPAVAGSPVITTIVDASGLLIFFLIARWYFQV